MRLSSLRIRHCKFSRRSVSPTGVASRWRWCSATGAGGAFSSSVQPSRSLRGRGILGSYQPTGLTGRARHGSRQARRR